MKCIYRKAYRTNRILVTFEFEISLLDERICKVLKLSGPVHFFWRLFDAFEACSSLEGLPGLRFITGIRSFSSIKNICPTLEALSRPSLIKAFTRQRVTPSLAATSEVVKNFELAMRENYTHEMLFLQPNS